MKRAFILILVLSLAPACVMLHAKKPVERPPLEVPPVPARVIVPAPAAEAPPEPVADLPPAPVSPRPRPQRETRDAPKPDAKPPETAPVETPPATPPPPPAVPPLRTPTTADSAEAARRVGEMIDRARKTLSTVDYRKLSSEQRTQYHNAQLFIKQAEDAVKAANFEFAKGLAEKAEKLAKELPGR